MENLQKLAILVSILVFRLVEIIPPVDLHLMLDQQHGLRTKGMESGLTDHVWTLKELLGKIGQ